MDNCCADKSCAVDELRGRQGHILRIVLAINAAMFAVELAAGIVAGSVSLLADSLDMLGDAMVYGFSLYVVARSDLWKARAAMAKAGVMAAFGLFVLGQVIYKLVTQQLPGAETMGAVGALALAANAVCFALLWRHRAQDINMRSVWLCSRNDLVANVAVLAAAALVWATATPWPDIAVGALICALFLQSAYVVAREASAEIKKQKAPPVQRISIAIRRMNK
jgi:cation diffusion facilitator family transporter